jgi:hypothetical protein
MPDIPSLLGSYIDETYPRLVQVSGSSFADGLGTPILLFSGTSSFATSASYAPDSRPYKVYTALLTQKGGSNPAVVNSGNLVVGATYQIITPSDGDWTNVGAPNNNADTYFVATGTTPNSWGTAGELGYNGGAPEVIVLENTIGNIWYTYNDYGEYSARCNDLFIENKTIATNNALFFSSTNAMTTNYSAPNQIFISTFLMGTGPVDNVLNKTYIEIRVYN